MIKLLGGDIKYLEVYKDENVELIFSSKIGWSIDRSKEILSEILSVEKDQIYDLKQVHGNKVYDVDENTENFVGQGDGLLTNLRGKCLMTYHADCTPIYFHTKDLVGICHSGWKGTLNNIAKELIDKMVNDYGANPYDIKVVIGPSIKWKNYEVQEDVYRLFNEKFGLDSQVIKKDKEKYYLDMDRANEINLLGANISKSNIVNLNLCTYDEEKLFYSYRRDGRFYSNMVGAIKLL